MHCDTTERASQRLTCWCAGGNVGMNPGFVLKETTRMVYRGHSISHSLSTSKPTLLDFGRCSGGLARSMHGRTDAAWSCYTSCLTGNRDSTSLIWSALPQTFSPASSRPRTVCVSKTQIWPKEFLCKPKCTGGSHGHAQKMEASLEARYSHAP